MNANLLGLNLLHMKHWPYLGDMIPIIRLLPLLETLIITTQGGVNLFRAFLPIDANGTSGAKQASGEGKTLAIVCPRLQYLQIGHEGSWLQPGLIPSAKDIITVHAEYGSPLKIFTLFEFLLRPRRKLELIGRDGSFIMEKQVLAEEVEGLIVICKKVGIELCAPPRLLVLAPRKLGVALSNVHR